MAPLPGNLRRDLEDAIIEARDVAVDGSREALEALTAHEGKRGTHLSKEQATLRNRLRAHGHQIGDARNRKNGAQEIFQLEQECAYEHWHRMIFARFLAENNLLVEPDSQVSVTLEEVEELAREESIDHWELAARYAQAALPAIFRSDDPLLEVTLPRETRLKLEQILESLPSTVFVAEDSLGWVYQFWQSAEKKRVNESGDKITGETLPAVTQLFTEPYMVSFLLHNTLGAWHAGKVLGENSELAESAVDEAELRNAVRLGEAGGYEFDYLRFVRSSDEDDSSNETEKASGPWRPMGGTFDGWPTRAAELKVLDPCCGSGHFLVAAFNLLVRLRMHEEQLSARDAVAEVLRDNLFGLEIDPRCTQIAAFALAVAAWKFPDESGDSLGYHALPTLNIACTGIAPQATEDEWLELAEQSGLEMNAVSREPILNGLRNLHAMFSDAPTLGSLINPNELPADLITADYETLKPYLEAALEAEQGSDEAHERAVAAAGMVRAAELLADEYTLVITNVPFLGWNDQCEVLQEFTDTYHEDAKTDLASCFVERCCWFRANAGTTALVTIQNWLFLKSFTKFRVRMLKRSQWDLLARVGPRGFETITGERVNVALLSLTDRKPTESHGFGGVDVSEKKRPLDKAQGLLTEPVVLPNQLEQLSNPGKAVTLEAIDETQTLGKHAVCYQGLSSTDAERFAFRFWELDKPVRRWRRIQSPPKNTDLYAGRENVIDWQSLDAGVPGAAIRGHKAWGRIGVAIGQVNRLPATCFRGERFVDSAPVIVPNVDSDLPAIWAFLCSPDFNQQLRKINPKLSVNNGYVGKVAFDLDHWQQVAAKQYPGGLPEPESDDPTQWLFHGRPDCCTSPMHAAVARLLGYRWPAELDSKMHLNSRARDLVNSCDELLSFADRDGIVCIPAVRSEEGAAIHLRRLLDACGIEVPHDIDSWLRNGFFKEHCDVFHNIPFVWHIWDGRKNDGFHALVNYHKLAGPDGHKLLESLTYSYLGDWISRQESDVKSGASGADGRLAAAKSLQDQLKAILAGEPPYDIFVRWKPLHEQPIGWHPDINDGVRMNIRPFMAVDIEGGRKGAGILRLKPNIKWKKDRGKEPERPREDFPWFWDWDEETQDFAGGETFTAERWNDCHYTNKFKQQARDNVLQEAK